MIFITLGAGGSGKSVVLRVNAKYLKDQFIDKPNFFKIGAPTGTGNALLELRILFTFNKFFFKISCLSS